MASNVQEQEGNIQPPRIGYIWAQAVDATSRVYDLYSLKFQDENANTSPANTQNYVWLDLEALTNDVYFAFSDGSGFTIDSSASSTNAAGTSLASATKLASPLAGTGFPAPVGTTTSPAARIPAGTIRPVRINRITDRYLYLMCLATQTATLRITPSSQGLPGAGIGP